MDFNARRPHQVQVVLNAVDGNSVPAPGNTNVIQKPLVLELITHFEPGPAEPGDPGGPRAAVEINGDVEPLAPEPADEA